MQISGSVLAEKPQILSVKNILIDGWQRRQRKRVGIHVSDLLGCRRKVCFNRLFPDEETLSDRQIAFFHNGVEKHQELQAILGEDWNCEKEFIFKDGGLSIVAHPDAVYNGPNGKGVILEIKTTTKSVQKPNPNHIAQISAYISILSALGYQVPYGKLLYILLTPDNEEYLVEFLVEVSEDERKQILEKIIGEAAELQYGIDSRNPSLVQHSMRDRNYYGRGGISYLCRSCPYLSKCLTMQKESGEIDEGEELYYQMLYQPKTTNS
jgi:CRISPR/Cas system-associated exonuclease Cas4 (RecB family)